MRYFFFVSILKYVPYLIANSTDNDVLEICGLKKTIKTNFCPGANLQNYFKFLFGKTKSTRFPKLLMTVYSGSHNAFKRA